jgi:hypothetical protein
VLDFTVLVIHSGSHALHYQHQQQEPLYAHVTPIITCKALHVKHAHNIPLHLQDQPVLINACVWPTGILPLEAVHVFVPLVFILTTVHVQHALHMPLLLLEAHVFA